MCIYILIYLLIYLCMFIYSIYLSIYSDRSVFKIDSDRPVIVCQLSRHLREEAVQYVTAGHWDGKDLEEEERYKEVSSELRRTGYICCII